MAHFCFNTALCDFALAAGREAAKKMPREWNSLKFDAVLSRTLLHELWKAPEYAEHTDCSSTVVPGEDDR